MTNRTLYIVVCGAPLASRTADGVKAARANGWDPYVIPTEAALPWLVDQDLGDAPVITGNRTPDQPRRTPPADAIAVVPTTFNTLNAWANGNANTYPLTILCAALGSQTRPSPSHSRSLTSPATRLASFPGSPPLRRHPARECARRINGTSVTPLESGSGENISAGFKWTWVLEQLEQKLN